MTEEPSITCPKCGMTSFNRNDISEGYCGNCHDWTGTPQPLDDRGLWVRSDPRADGTYGITVTVGADFAWSLDQGEAVAYATLTFKAAMTAEHDAAVFEALRRLPDLDDEWAAKTIRDLREKRPTLTWIPRVTFIPSVSTEGEPFLMLCVDGNPEGQVTTDALREHAGWVLCALAACDLDTALVAELTGRIGVDMATAQAFVTDLRTAWPDPS